MVICMVFNRVFKGNSILWFCELLVMFAYFWPYLGLLSGIMSIFFGFFWAIPVEQ